MELADYLGLRRTYISDLERRKEKRIADYSSNNCQGLRVDRLKLLKGL